MKTEKKIYIVCWGYGCEQKTLSKTEAIYMIRNLLETYNDVKIRTEIIK